MVGIGVWLVGGPLSLDLGWLEIFLFESFRDSKLAYWFGVRFELEQ